MLTFLVSVLIRAAVVMYHIGKGDIPLHVSIMEGSDMGKPITVAQPESHQSKAYYEIAEKIWKKL